MVVGLPLENDLDLTPPQGTSLHNGGIGPRIHPSSFAIKKIRSSSDVSLLNKF